MKVNIGSGSGAVLSGYMNQCWPRSLTLCCITASTMSQQHLSKWLLRAWHHGMFRLKIYLQYLFWNIICPRVLMKYRDVFWTMKSKWPDPGSSHLLLSGCHGMTFISNILTHCPWEMWLLSETVNLQTQIKVIYLEHFIWKCPQVNATRPH